MGATGTTTVNFGTFPGSTAAKVDITGQGSILAGSLVEAWLLPVATGDHSVDEHRMEPIRVIASDISAGVGFSIWAYYTGIPQSEPTQLLRMARFGGTGLDAGPGKQDVQGSDLGGKAIHLYGQYTVGWVWN